MLGARRNLAVHQPQLEKFGGEAATIVDAAVRRANEVENLPRLNRFSPNGERIEDVVHSLDHHIAGRYIYGSGAMSAYSEPGNNLLALTLFYLSSQNGEAGHNCPLACTAGVIKTARSELEVPSSGRDSFHDCSIPSTRLDFTEHSS